MSVIGRSNEEFIRIRWGVSDPITWHYTKSYGFTIERVTVLSGGKVLKDRPRLILTSEVIKPQELPDWEPFMDDDYVAIAAQSIYGETFEPEMGNSAMVSAINQAKELENRFSFLMFACDQSVKAADLSGLYFEDRQVHVGEKYLYRIYANVPPEIHAIDTGKVFVGLSDYYPLPAPRDVEVSFDDKVALISWNSSVYSKEYNAFWVERSDDGGTSFKPIHDKPMITTVKDQSSLNERSYKTDSLSGNGIEYLYRVIGISAFGEMSVPSDTVGGHGIPAFNYAPVFKSYEVLNENGVLLRWEFPDEYEGLVSNFKLVRERSNKTGYDTVLEDLPSDTREVVDPFPLSSNYYVIQAQNAYGRTTSSFPYLVQLEDSIPPLAPANLQGSIDTTGYVTISWDANTESDLHGYKVYKSNFKDGEFIQVPGDMLTSNSFEERILIKNLTRSIFYRLRAFDNRYNPSEFSEILSLKKPDVIPPVTPVFKRISTDSLGITIEFEKSPSEDVVQYLLYRQARKEAQWTLIYSITSDHLMNYYHDQEVNDGEQYAYTLVALDDAGLESFPSKPILGEWRRPSPYPAVDIFDYERRGNEVRLFWTYQSQQVHHYIIYKSSGDFGMQQYKKTQNNEYVDTYPSLGSKKTVKYAVMAVFANGARSEMSQTITLEE